MSDRPKRKLPQLLPFYVAPTGAHIQETAGGAPQSQTGQQGPSSTDRGTWTASQPAGQLVAGSAAGSSGASGLLLAPPSLPPWDKRYRLPTLGTAASSQSPGWMRPVAKREPAAPVPAAAISPPASAHPAGAQSPLQSQQQHTGRNLHGADGPSLTGHGVAPAVAAVGSGAGVDATASAPAPRPSSAVGSVLPPAAADDLWDWEAPVQGPASTKRATGQGRSTRPPAAAGAPEGARGPGARSRASRRQAPPAAAAPAAAPAGDVVEAQVVAAAAAASVAPPSAPPLVITPPDADGPVLQVPGSIAGTLRPYQVDGVSWLGRQYAHGLGGVLADDMGLGKTLQAIAFVAALLGKTGDGWDSLSAARRYPTTAGAPGGVAGEGVVAPARWPLLVVAPTSVLENWQREFERWGTFQVREYHGSPAEREATVSAAKEGRVEVVVTGYAQLQRYSHHLADAGFHAVIFDEVHKLKTATTATYQAAASLPTSLRYGLTGTPMQNKYEELWCLMDWVAPGALGPRKEFMSYYAAAIKAGQRLGASTWEVSRGRERNNRLCVLLRRLMLRRDKRLIADQLPRKTDNIVFCRLAPAQVAAYHALLQLPELRLLMECAEPCRCGSGERGLKCCLEDTDKVVEQLQEMDGLLWNYYHCCTCSDPGCKMHKPDGCEGRPGCPWCLMLPAIMLLQKVANHLELLRPDPARPGPDGRKYAFEDALWRRIGGDALASDWLGRSTPQHCGKLAALMSLLAAWATEGRNKVLLFSHSTRALDLLQEVVQRQGYESVRLDGSTPAGDRQPMVDDFNTRPSLFAFLISTLAGGVGLNLTAANKVVIFDPSWNPAADLQAQDRAFRLGQTQDVGVYRLVAAGTLEEVVYGRQIYKQQQQTMTLTGAQEKRQFKGVQDDPAHRGELWGIANLLRADPGLEGASQQPQQPWQRQQQQQRQPQQQEQGEEAAAAALAAAVSAPAGSSGGVSGAESTEAPGLLGIVKLDDLLGGDDDLLPIDQLLEAVGQEAGSREASPSRSAEQQVDPGGRGAQHIEQGNQQHTDQPPLDQPSATGEVAQADSCPAASGHSGLAPAAPRPPDATLADLEATGAVFHLHQHDQYLGAPSQASQPPQLPTDLDPQLGDLAARARTLTRPAQLQVQHRSRPGQQPIADGRKADLVAAAALRELQEALSSRGPLEAQPAAGSDVELLEWSRDGLAGCKLQLDQSCVAIHAPHLAALAAMWQCPLADAAEVVLGLSEEQRGAVMADYDQWWQQQVNDAAAAGDTQQQHQQQHEVIEIE